MSDVIIIERKKITKEHPDISKYSGYSFVHRDADIHWTARAIWNETMRGFDLLFDRQAGSGTLTDKKRTPEAEDFLDWMKPAVDKLHEAFKDNNITQRSDEYVLLKDNRFTIMGTPNSSHGYAYLSAWVNPEESE